MSGAFNEYDTEGFHFSPVIPYGYYGAKSGPALQDMEISAKVKMEIDPDKPGSQYGGLICRSSRDGMYMARHRRGRLLFHLPRHARQAFHTAGREVI